VAIKTSAGVLIFYKNKGVPRVLLVHSNGREEIEAWSIPKGEFNLSCELPRSAAVRELHEEIGVKIPEEELIPLGESRYRNRRKRVFCFAWETGTEPVLKLQEREVSLASFMTIQEAREKLHKDQVVFLERLLKLIETSTFSGVPSGSLSLT
jgi:predicted NUDIX family NTP pyrophosphohydrolase